MGEEGVLPPLFDLLWQLLLVPGYTIREPLSSVLLPDPHGFRVGWIGAKMTLKNRKKGRNLTFLSAECSLLRAGGQGRT